VKFSGLTDRLFASESRCKLPRPISRPSNGAAEEALRARLRRTRDAVIFIGIGGDINESSRVGEVLVSKHRGGWKASLYGVKDAKSPGATNAPGHEIGQEYVLRY
jgi:hypothetical protein